jgi:integrase/recombinase XerD
MNALTSIPDYPLATDIHRTAELAAAADEAAQQTAFGQYQLAKSDNTLTRQRANLAKFAAFLNLHGASVSADELFSQAGSWGNISFGLVEAYKLNLVQEGYALSSVNVYLSTIKSYAKLAYKSGVLSADDYNAIKVIEGYSGRSATNVNAKRPVTRISSEKEQAVLIPVEIIHKLKHLDFYPDTPAGKRDCFIMCMMVDHGLRASEVVGLTVGKLDTATLTLEVYRHKTDSTDNLHLTAETFRAFTAYFNTRPNALAHDMLIVTGRKGGKLNEGKAMHRVNLTNLVNRIGRRLAKRYGLSQLEELSAHDLRHTWATHASNTGTPVNILMTAGGWSNPAMPLKYSVAGKVANEGVKLPY